TIARVRETHVFLYSIIDIDEEQWGYERFHDLVPVVFADDREIARYRMSEQELVAALRELVAIVMMTKSAVPGEVKTRMIGALTADQAAQLQREMALHTLERLRKDHLPRVYVLHAGDLTFETENAYPQAPGDLGTRMAAVAQQMRDSGYSRALLVGS